MSHRELNPTVGELPPVFDHRHVSGSRKLIEDFAGFQPSGFDWEREDGRRLRAGHPVCHIAWTNEHVGPPMMVGE
jgi:hypothetical protein